MLFHLRVLKVSSAGSLPRNVRQVKNLRQKVKSSSGSFDKLHSVMMICKDTTPDFVRTVTGAPDYMVFLALDRTPDYLVRFCAGSQCSSELSILTFDPTFSLGEFDVTVSTYEHSLITFRNLNDHTSRDPSLISPVLIHQRKQFANYHYLTSTMIAFRPGLHHLRWR